MPQIILMKAEYLIVLSFLLTFVVITNAFYTKRQFYSSVVYLTKSSTSLAVLYAQAFVFAVLFGKLVQRIFLGQLRAIETEHLYDRTWYSVTETCLAFTVFREDFSPRFVALFALLLFLKCFHWLLEDRVDYMEQSPVLGTIFHARVTSLLSLLLLLDYLFVSSAYAYTVTRGASVQIVFGFEYAILLVSVLSTGIKYILHSIEIRTGEQWENKGVFMLYADLVLGFARLTLYMLFVIVMMKIHTFPLFAIRPMFIAMRAFRKSCNDVIESRRAIRDLNTMYADQTAEELDTVVDKTCIICREDMQVQQSIKRLGCQHIFHKNCLRSWFQRQQTCPICRTPVLRSTTPRSTVNNAQPAAAAAPPPQAPVAPTEVVPPRSPEPPTSSAPSSTVPPLTNLASSPTATSQTPFSLPNLMSMGSFPMVLPPFAFPPPPLPPLNFTGMSEEAIRAMEDTELAHVQARLHCLQNVRTLLDASMVQMQQYMDIVLTQSHLNNHGDEALGPSDKRTCTTTNDLHSLTTEEGPAEEIDADLIRRRRLEHYAHTPISSSTEKNDASNGVH